MGSLLRRELRLMLVAVQFLTRVPVPRWVDFEPTWLQASARHFPLVGAIVGLGGAIVLWGAACWWPLSVAVGLSMAFTIWLTGGFHEDGLADTCDGLGGSVSRERALQIMKDSRVGSYGVLGLILVLGVKATALWSLTQHGLFQAALPACVLAHTISRSAVVLMLRCLPYAGDVQHAKAKPLAGKVSTSGALTALVWSLGLAAMFLTNDKMRFPVAAALIGTMLSTLACGRWFNRRLGGTTGDTLGAAQQFGEVAALLGWLLTIDK